MEFFIRTEDIRPEDIPNLYVEMKQDRPIINALLGTSPTILVGSRGVGKSFLFRIAQNELLNSFEEKRVLPVYLTFRSSALVNSSNENQFYSWMLAKICSEIVRTLKKKGILSPISDSLRYLSGGDILALNQKSSIEIITEQFENSWQTPGIEVDVVALPSIDELLYAIEDICQSFHLNRISLFIDEAAHIFLPKQQRQFFTLFRDLRSPYLTLNAAVYPGVTVYGDTFQPTHDATFLEVNRDITDSDYVDQMKEIVRKQSSSTDMRHLSTRGANFSILAYAASGNPRHLLKTVARSGSLDSNSVNTTIREYYRTEIWSEHSQLSDKYENLAHMVDWGREFIEDSVLPETKEKNDRYLADDKNTSAYFWVHRNAPQLIKESLRILEYTGIITGHSQGIRASRSEVGTRYTVNFGCLLALEDVATKNGLEIARNLTVKRMTEYGMNHKLYQKLDSFTSEDYIDVGDQLAKQLSKSINSLDLTPWQKSKLQEVGLNTISDVLSATESTLMQAYYVAETRARQMKNAALAAVYEYLVG